LSLIGGGQEEQRAFAKSKISSPKQQTDICFSTKTTEIHEKISKDTIASTIIKKNIDNNAFVFLDFFSCCFVISVVKNFFLQFELSE
jgi:hypothetical protein